MPYTRPYSGGFVDFPATTTPINATALNTMDVGIKTANDQFQSVTTTERTALTPTVGQCVWDSTLRQLMVYMNASGGNAWQPIGNALVCTSTTRPSTPFEGQVIRETDTNKELTYSGSAWVQTNTWGTTSGVTGVNNLIAPPSARVIRSSNLTSYTSASAITWSSAAFDTDGMFSAGSPTVLTVQTSGLYVIAFSAYVSGTATITRILPKILKTGTSIQFLEATVASGNESGFAISTIRNLTAGDTISTSVQFVGGSAYVIAGFGSEGETQSSLSMTWIGRTS
jgi:hypothetical protein